jgi:hypothetical protein
MSLLLNTPPVAPAVERVTPQQTDALFNFRPGTVDELAAELQAPKQQFAVPPAPGMPGTGSPPPEETPADLRREAAVAATQIIDMVDSTASFAVSFIGKKDAKQYRIDAGGKQMLKPYLAEYLKGKSVDIPPGFMLLFMAVMIYTPVIQRALDDRKEWKAQQAKTAPAPAPAPEPVPEPAPAPETETIINHEPSL